MLCQSAEHRMPSTQSMRADRMQISADSTGYVHPRANEDTYILVLTRIHISACERGYMRQVARGAEEGAGAQKERAGRTERNRHAVAVRVVRRVLGLCRRCQERGRE
eukprot:1207011-Rhodomonas_salina.1